MRLFWEWLKEHKEVVALVAIIALSVWIRSLFVYDLLDRDEGSYGFVAKEILRGGIPYRDAIEMKPPGVFYLYALAIKLFGATVTGLRIFTTIYSQLTLLCVFACARLLYGSRAGLLAAFFFALFGSVPMMEAGGSNTEVFFCLPLAAAVLCMMKAGQTGRQGFVWASACCAALAALIKTVAAPYVIVLAIFSLFAYPSSTVRGVRIRNFTGFVLVFWLVIGVVVAYFYVQGALQEFLLWNVVIPLKYAKGLAVKGPSLAIILPRLAPEYLTLAIASLPALLYCVKKRRDFAFALMLWLLPAVVAGISMPMKFFPHYFIQMLPFFCILSGVGVALILQMRVPWLLMWLVVIFASFGWFVKKDYSFYFVDSPEVVSIKKFGMTFVDAVQVAEYIKANTAPTDFILQWGFEPEIYFLADRRSAVPYPNSTALKVLENVDAGIQDFVNKVTTAKPKYIIIQKEWANYPGYAELQRIMQMAYHQEVIIGRGYYSRFYIYRLNA